MITSHVEGIIQRYVYFAKANDMMKIGCSIKPVKRLLAIAEWVPFKMEIVATMRGGFEMESAFHSYFEEEWSHMEWFHVTPKMEAMIARIQAGEHIELPVAEALKRKSEIVKLKNAATRRIRGAESRSGLYSTYPREHMRPKYLNDAIDAYTGAGKPAPDDYVLAAISRYEHELQQITKKEAK